MSVQLSIVVPTLNSERFLVDTLSSIRSIPNVTTELLVVDSGSTDDTAAIAKFFNARVLYAPPGNMYSAIHEGWSKACGDVVAYINSDDAVRPKAYSQLLAQMVETGADVAYGNCDFISADGIFLHGYRSAPVRLVARILRTGAMPFCQQAAVLSREMVQMYPLNLRYKLCADYELFTRLSLARRSFLKFDGEPVAAFRIHAAQKSNVECKEARAEKLIAQTDLNLVASIADTAAHLVHRIANWDHYLVRIIRYRQLTGRLRIPKTIAPLPNHDHRRRYQANEKPGPNVGEQQ